MMAIKQLLRPNVFFLNEFSTLTKLLQEMLNFKIADPELPYKTSSIFQE